MKPLHGLCTAVIINYQTPDLVRRAFTSFHHYYPDIHVTLVDNGSQDSSATMLKELQQQYPERITLVLHPENLHHGPAMDAMLKEGDSAYVLFIDSDCEVYRNGFVEQMIERAERGPKPLAVGKRIYMTKRGFDSDEAIDTVPYIRPFCMLIHREHYLALPPFQKHGSPCLATMIEASKQGYALLDFPVLEYVHHTGRGTVARHGYQLGWKSKMNYVLHKLGL